MGNAVEVRNLNKTYKSKIVLYDYSLDIKEGEFLGLYGKSGSGKTTFLNILCQFISPEDGFVSIFGQEMKYGKNEGDEVFRLHNIAYISQDFNLLEDLTVYQNLELGLHLSKIKDRNEKKTLIENQLRSLDIFHLVKTKVKKLSGGEKQRVAIGRELMKNCSLILCDEPTSALDEDNEKVVMDILKDLVNEGKTVIMTSHNNLHLKYFTRVISMEEERFEDDN